MNKWSLPSFVKQAGPFKQKAALPSTESVCTCFCKLQQPNQQIKLLYGAATAKCFPETDDPSQSVRRA